MQPPRGTFLLVALLSLVLAVVYGRELSHDRDEPPAFYVEKRDGIAVLLGEGFPAPGVHQFSDGTSPRDVIKMTGLEISTTCPESSLSVHPLLNGEALDILEKNKQVSEIKRFFMPAAQRVVLGVPLHPDRMSSEDWEALAGIGPRLAQAIEEDRQLNGDFGSLAGLQRVKGIGPKRLIAWKDFFGELD